MMRIGLVLAATTLVASLAFPAQSRVVVRVEGAVAQPGAHELRDDARLSDAALAGKVLPEAYPLGAAWLRPSLLRAQRELQAGILYDFGALHRQALESGNLHLAQMATRLRQWMARLPVTGREPALLDPRVVEITPAENRPVADGDALFYPRRPTRVRVVGAVTASCTLAFEPLATASDYWRQCPRDALADRDWAWVIEPDGRRFRRGIAAWNRSAPLPLAPGATLYVPLRASLTAGIDANMDRDIATFLATQTLPGGRP